MHKHLITYCTLLLLLICFDGKAQSFELSETDIHIRGKVGERIERPINIKNLTDRSLSLIIERVQNNISNGQSTFICWGKDCAENTSLHKNLNTNQPTAQVIATLEAGISGGFSSVKYLIYNKTNPQDAVYLTITYTIEEPINNQEVYNSDKIKIKDVYPNPVSDYLYINYQLTDLNANAKVGIHNVLGSVVNEFQLEPMESKAKINTTELNPGVYFYSLSINNETILIKKFVVRK